MCNQLQPLVSCILPTRNRVQCIKLAIDSYLSQTYPNKELVVVDNGADATEALIPKHPSIRYEKIEGQLTVGAMRNACIERAGGEIICHFDSDDWSAPERVMDQVTRLGPLGVVTGYWSMLFYDQRSQRCYKWMMSDPFILGTSLCYRKSWWELHRFSNLMVGEDFKFFQEAMRNARKHVTFVDVQQMMVALIHDHQTSHKQISSARYQPIPITNLPKGFPCVLTS